MEVAFVRQIERCGVLESGLAAPRSKECIPGSSLMIRAALDVRGSLRLPHKSDRSHCSVMSFDCVFCRISILIRVSTLFGRRCTGWMRACLCQSRCYCSRRMLLHDGLIKRVKGQSRIVNGPSARVPSCRSSCRGGELYTIPKGHGVGRTHASAAGQPPWST